MPAYPVRALVLRKTKLGETDVIVALLTDDGRRLQAVAKGMRKPGSRFGGRLEPYSVVDLLLHTGRSLEVVSEAETVAAHAPLREDYDRSIAAAVVADVLDKLAVEGQPEERLFGLAHATLDAMEDVGLEGLPLLVVAFLVKAMAMHGYRPELDSCACCAEQAAGGRLFSLADGGVLCPQCGFEEGAAGMIRFSEEGRTLLDALLRATMRQVADGGVLSGGQGSDSAARTTVRECFELVRSFVAYHVPARLKALDHFAGAYR